MVRAFGKSSMDGFESPSNLEIFRLRNFHKNTRSCVEMNAVAPAQLAFHMLTLFQQNIILFFSRILYHHGDREKSQGKLDNNLFFSLNINVNLTICA